MIVAGIDVGSVAAKGVVFDAGTGAVLGGAVLPTGWNAREAGLSVLEAACADAGRTRSCVCLEECGGSVVCLDNCSCYKKTRYVQDTLKKPFLQIETDYSETDSEQLKVVRV